MILIGENIHIISKQVREALLNRDEAFINNLIDLQKNTDYIDLNIGLAKGQMENVFPWLVSLIGERSKISFDTTNFDEMKRGIDAVKSSDCFINSTSFDEPKLTNLINLAVEKGCNLVALTLSKETGIPKTADGRLEIAFNIYEKCIEMGMDSSKIYFDPLILPVCVEQSQGLEAINTIKMIKESFDPPVKTVVGLSNISNGCPIQLRSLINRVFAVLASGAGLDSAIVDAKDLELIRVMKMLENKSPENEVDNLYINLAQMVENFDEISSVEYDKNSTEQKNIIKCADILLNNSIYSNSFTQI